MAVHPTPRRALPALGLLPLLRLLRLLRLQPVAAFGAVLVAALTLVLTSTVTAAQVIEGGRAAQMARSAEGMVVAAHPRATEAGVRMLERGGNAVDAAVAAAFALAVVEPSMSGLGGRTQILLRLPSGEIHGIDATTQAPATYVDSLAPRARYGYGVVGVPGTVAGLTAAAERFGTLPLSTLVGPAMELARGGFELLPGEAARQAAVADQVAETEGGRTYFLRPDGTPRPAGTLWVQEDLAEVLEAIGREGADVFYRGWIAERIAADMDAHGGHVTLEALADYAAEESRVVRGGYRGHELAGLWVPSYGAITIEILHLLETLDMSERRGAAWAAALHEAIRVAYQDRSEQDTWADAGRLTSRAWARRRASEMRLDGAWSSPAGGGAAVPARPAAAPASPGAPSWLEDPGHTTHLTTADAAGMVVALTQSNGPNMGSRVATPGLGFLYAATLGGYLGVMEPGERARSHISPFLVLRDGEPYLALGAAGGGRIPPAIAAVISRLVDHGMSLGDALRAPRVYPDGDELDAEAGTGAGFTAAEVARLREMGFEVEVVEDPGSFGRVHAVLRDGGEWVGGADPDWEGTAAGPAGDLRDPGHVGAGGAVEYDVLIRGGRVLDGTGNPWYRADVGIRGDRIAALGDLSGADARQVVDATGLWVAPGFIDTHSHAGGGLATPGLSHARPLLAQGVTTILANPDGGGMVELAAQRDSLLKDGLGVNVGLLVPHGSVRRAVMGTEDRLATGAELERMRALVRQGMEEGAWGLSSGPFYVPGSYSDTRELVELARVAGELGGAYTSHVRDESDYTVGVLAAVEEVITVGREAGVPAVWTHAKALGPPVWGFSAALVHRLEAARAEGVEVYTDQYPYPASATGLSAALLPRWSQAGGDDSLQSRLDRPESRARIEEAMRENLARRGGPARIQFRRFREDPSIEGKTLEQVARERDLDAIQASVALFRQGSPSIVSFNMHEDDVRRIMVQPWNMTASDGDLVPFGEGVPHPRSYGAFTRKLTEYVLEEGVVGLDAAVRSMTSLPAQVFRMADRGSLRPGAAADVVVFDLDRLRTPATFTDPHHLSEGMVHVWVNGEPAVRDGGFTGAMSGRVLRKR